jgi:Zn-dependent alcohol dehydrogenase
MIVRAAVVRAPYAAMSLEDLTLEEPRADEVLVRVVATGVCHTDQHGGRRLRNRKGREGGRADGTRERGSLK